MKISLIGRLLYNFENIICKNFRKFIGNHEKTIEVLFLITYVTLQLILLYFLPKTIIASIVIIFLFLLTLERITVHIWLDEERKKIKRETEKLRKDYAELKDLAYQEIYNIKQK
ncbi:hypothetical protein HOD75_00775 [archaeon]|jgi:hypothetical protein|nr:hypothetical protein [archaeon]MBT4241410.1 hypothetical protein [archaeon]MBT4418231.1 hypothetical protein [archaeon]